MTQRKHTPLPWKNGIKYDPITVWSGQDTVKAGIREIAFCGRTLSKILPEETKQANEANAEFIVQACNNHYELLDALETIEKELSGFLISDYQTASNPKPDQNNEVVMNARTVLTKAKGEQS